MEAAGDDVPSTAPVLPIDVAAVGMRRHDVIVAVANPLAAGGDVHAVCTLDLSAAVPRTRRGLHLSRFGEVVASSTVCRYDDVLDYASSLARQIAHCQYGDATVMLRARIPYVEDLTQPCHSRVKHSLEHLHAIACVRVSPQRTEVDVGLQVPHLVACPCVQKTYAHALRLQGAAGQKCATPGPLLTHSQRCTTTAILRGFRGSWRAADVLSALDSVLVRTRNTLPRDLELATVYRAHRNPQFIEDAARAATAAVSRCILTSGAFRRIDVRSRSLESIHDFDLTARVSLSAAQCRGLDRA